MRSVTDVISLTQRNRSKCVDKKLSNKAMSRTFFCSKSLLITAGLKINVIPGDNTMRITNQ